MTFCENPLSRSLLGVKRTWPFAAHMSAYDPKRTSRGLWSQRPDSYVNSGRSVSDGSKKGGVDARLAINRRGLRLRWTKAVRCGVGRKGVEALLDVVANPTDKRVPVIARACLAALGAQLCRLKEQILEFDRMIIAWHRSHEASKRLDAIPGVGPVLATALIASIADPKAFLAFTRAWLAAVPVRVISSPDRPNTRPPQRYRATRPGA